MQANVERVHSADDISARKQFREANLRASRSFSQMVRRNGVSVQAEVRPRVYSRQEILERLSYYVIQILPGRLTRNIRVRYREFIAVYCRITVVNVLIRVTVRRFIAFKAIRV